MDIDQLKEHLRFARELGVTGVSRDPAWRAVDTPRGAVPISAGVPVADTRVPVRDDAQPVTIALTPIESLAAVRTDIGDCTRCKLHTLGRTQIVFGVATPMPISCSSVKRRDGTKTCRDFRSSDGRGSC